MCKFQINNKSFISFTTQSILRLSYCLQFNAFLYSFSRNGDSDINRSKLLNGFINQATSNKYEDFTESFWGSRNSIENQTRQHYLARNRYIAEQSLRLPYPSVYGTQSISKYLTDSCFKVAQFFLLTLKHHIWVIMTLLIF